MKVSIVQSSLVWENKSVNLLHFEETIAPLKDKTDLIVLPEMFSTGFSMNTAALAETMYGPTVAWMKMQAQILGAAITGSFICEEEGRYFNRLVFMKPDGQYQTYDKRHLFSLAKENDHFSSGTERLIVEWKGFKICPLICYDLRFPVWSRNTVNYDLLLYVANWPVPRSHHWRALLHARAIENLTYCIGVNVVGKDGNGHEYVGDSSIIHPSGQHLCQLSGLEGVFTAELSLEEVSKYRERFYFLLDSDQFTLQT